MDKKESFHTPKFIVFKNDSLVTFQICFISCEKNRFLESLQILISTNTLRPFVTTKNKWIKPNLSSAWTQLVSAYVKKIDLIQPKKNTEFLNPMRLIFNNSF